MNSRTINQQLMLFMIKHLLWVRKTENQVLLLRDFPQLTEDTKSCVRWPRSGSRDCWYALSLYKLFTEADGVEQ